MCRGRTHTVDEASAGPEVVGQLVEALGADRVAYDEATLHEFAMDASPCYVRPRAVVRPQSEADVVRTVRACRALRLPVTPRAAGTSLSGAAVGPGVVLDMTRLSEIHALDPERRVVRVGPGLPLLELNAFLEARGLFFPPDPGSQEWCRIGGMVGHNASGYRSVKYGQTKDYVESLRVVLADGEAVEAAPVPLAGPEWGRLADQVPAFDRIRHLIETHRDAIRSARRPVRKHACGYDVWSLADGLDRGVFSAPSLFVGSEGTLGVVTEVTLRVLPLPARRVTTLVFLERFDDLGPIVADVRGLEPSAMEAVDGTSLDLVGRDGLGLPAGASAMLLVEFDEGDLEAVSDRLANVIAPRYALSRPVETAFDPGRQADLWRARRALFPTLLRRPGPRRPWGFVEDPIVPLERVPDFIRFLANLARRHGTVAGIYGHIGDGNTHYRPLFDPTDPEDFARMQALRSEFDDAVLGPFQGAPSAEHGIGRIRADVLRRTWGDPVYDVMRAIKTALDPEGLLNPGVLFSDAAWWETWGGLESRAPL